jgi:hypothetical protein
LFYQGENNSNLNGLNFPFKPHYELLSKAVCTIDGSEFYQEFMDAPVQNDQDGFSENPEQLIERKSAISELEEYFSHQKYYKQ